MIITSKIFITSKCISNWISAVVIALILQLFSYLALSRLLCPPFVLFDLTHFLSLFSLAQVCLGVIFIHLILEENSKRIIYVRFVEYSFRIVIGWSTLHTSRILNVRRMKLQTLRIFVHLFLWHRFLVHSFNITWNWFNKMYEFRLIICFY